MRVMRAGEEEAYGDTQEEFLGWSELIAVIHLLPHVQVVESSSVEFKWDPSDPMKHQVRSEHVGDVGQGP